MQIISRARAKAVGKTQYFTGKPCPRGHITVRWVGSYSCDACQRLDLKARYDANANGRRDSQIETARASYQKDLENSRAYQREYSRRTYEKRKPYLAAWVEANREHLLAYGRARMAAASDEEREKKRVHVRNRRASLRNAEGKHTAIQIRELLVRQRHKCPDCGKSLKHGYHVDHIRPLKLSGSNGIENIQLLCQSCNDRKAASDPLVWARKLGRLL